MTGEEVRRVLVESMALPSGPLVPFVKAAINRNNVDVTEASLDMRAYRSPAWRFAAELRGHPELASLEAWEAVLHLEETVGPDLWDELPSEDSRGVDADPREDFFDAWGRIDEPIRVVPTPADVVPLVEQHPLESERYPSPADEPYRRTASLCFWYAEALRDARIWMACRTVEATVGVPYRTAARHLRRLTRDGLLDAAGDHPRHERRAREYRVRVDAVTLAADNNDVVIAIGGTA